LSEIHELERRVREAAARWKCSPEEIDFIVSIITPESYIKFEESPDTYTVETISKTLASVVRFQIRLPLAVSQYLAAEKEFSRSV
jgi:hypothetical protein